MSVCWVYGGRFKDCAFMVHCKESEENTTVVKKKQPEREGRTRDALEARRGKNDQVT